MQQTKHCRAYVVALVALVAFLRGMGERRLGAGVAMTSPAARYADLNEWHHAIHQVTGDMALLFNRATAADLERWAKTLRRVAEEMGAEARRTA